MGKIISFFHECLYKKKISYQNKKIMSRFKSCGEGFICYGSPKISAAKHITCGTNVTLNDLCILNATSSEITLGNNITISSGAKILAATYDVDLFLKEHIKHHISKPVIIGDNVWICAGAIVNPGVTIRGDVIIAAGSVVTHDIIERGVIR